MDLVDPPNTVYSRCPYEETTTVGSASDQQWLYLKLNARTKFQFLRLISTELTTSLRSVTESIDIVMPKDIKFSEMDVRVSKLRWLMKACVLVTLTLVNLQMFEFTIVSHAMITFYDTTLDLVNWTSLIYMLCYVLLTFPVSYLLDNRIMNLRTAMIVCGSLITFGCLVKTLSVNFMSFAVAFMGQFLVALGQVIILNIPTQLAFEWFAANEKMLICNLSIFGMQLGMLLGFVTTPWLVHMHESLEDIAADLNRLNYFHLGLVSFQLVLVVSVFRAQPDSPPCYLQAIQEKSRCAKQFFWKTFRKLSLCRDFNWLSLGYALHIGAISTIFTMINPMIRFYLPEAEDESGLLGATIISSSLSSSLIMILVLRQNQRHLKPMGITAAVLSTGSVISFVIGLLTGSSWLLYASAVCIGIFSTAFQTIGYESAFEMSFPESDGTVSGILNVCAQFFGILTTSLVSASYSSPALGHLAGNLLLIAFLFSSVVCLALANCELKRYQAYQIIDTSAKQLDVTEKYLMVVGGERTPLLAK